MIELGVSSDIGRVLAAELKSGRGEGAGGGTLDGAAPRHRARKIDVVDAAGPYQLLGLLMRHDEIVEQALRQSCPPEGLGKSLADKQRLCRVLQDDSIAGQ